MILRISLHLFIFYSVGAYYKDVHNTLYVKTKMNQLMRHSFVREYRY